VGVAYRWVLQLVVWLVSNFRWYIGYGYDLETTRLADLIPDLSLLRYEIFKRNNKITTRFF
jgi:hypothetical protein